MQVRLVPNLQLGERIIGPTPDPEANRANRSMEGVISTPNSKVTVCVIPTDEELLVASDTMDIVK